MPFVIEYSNPNPDPDPTLTLGFPASRCGCQAAHSTSVISPCPCIKKRLLAQRDTIGVCHWETTALKIRCCTRRRGIRLLNRAALRRSHAIMKYQTLSRTCDPLSDNILMILLYHIIYAICFEPHETRGCECVCDTIGAYSALWTNIDMHPAPPRSAVTVLCIICVDL